VHFAGNHPFIIPPKSGAAIIQFDHEDPSIPLPDKEYFRVHQRIAQILEVSGIGYEIESELEKVKMDPENLDPGGSTDAGLLVSQRLLINVGI